MIILGAILFVFVLFVPGGVLGLAESLRARRAAGRGAAP
jgi:ABC-type branched-subunit amino acid transport system permease subunit